MPLQFDPEQNETRALFEIYPDFSDKRILEIGCGDGRLTWRYADRSARVIALDPDLARLERAVNNRPADFTHVDLRPISLEDFDKRNRETFDLAILAWSL
jgi:2-polyprenyl-3-methyl-5-hydroxy-6-metoxy-1,4-benzoquinol methylase